MTNFGVDFVPLEKDQKTKHCLHHQRIMESHIAAYAKEVIKSLTMQYKPSTTQFGPNGDQVLLERTPEELTALIDRGISIAEQTYQRLSAKGWLAEVPPLTDLLEEDANNVGFSGGK